MSNLDLPCGFNSNYLFTTSYPMAGAIWTCTYHNKICDTSCESNKNPNCFGILKNDKIYCVFHKKYKND